MSSSRCIYCGLDPFEYVDVEVAIVPVAVTCCDRGYLRYGMGMDETEVENYTNSTFFIHDLQHSQTAPESGFIFDEDDVIF